MTDLVQNLRGWGDSGRSVSHLLKLAADRIEQLERELKDCRNATLEEAAVKCDEVYYKNIGEGYAEVRYGIASCAKEIRSMKS
jgi:hypothetical protein